jgi:Leucine-rich repeat (LRR) protein
VATISEDFKAVYARELAESISLPQAIREEYDTAACLVSLEHKEIYLLSKKTTSELFVLKQRPQEQATFNEAEYAMLKTLEHEGIPKAVACFTAEGYSYLIRDYVKGSTLEQLLKVRGALSLWEIIDISLQLCGILEYLHSQTPSVIYRDLKPQNVIVAQNGSVRLIDFDISRKFSLSAARDTVFMGTAGMAPPEQYGYSQTDVRSDIYSLGVLMIYLGSGQYNIAAAGLLPAKLLRIAKRCTQFAPKDRYASIAQVRRRLYMLRHGAASKLKIALAVACSLALGFIGGFMSARNAVLPASAPAGPYTQAQKTHTRATQVSSDGVVSFASAQIEQNVRNQLNKSSGEPVYMDDLKAITTLCVLGDSEQTGLNSARMEPDGKLYINNSAAQRGFIDELTDIPLFENLMNLELFGQRITDVSPLEGMNLFTLNLGGNYIRDLKPLARMQTLKSLRVGNNPIYDLTPLKSLQNLREIGLENTQVYDLTPIGTLTRLESVNLFNTSCMDYSTLAMLPSLTYANISDTTKEDVAAVIKNRNLRTLAAHRCGIFDLSLFEGLDNLACLELWGNEITDLAGIEKMENLSSLVLNYTGVRDLTPLVNLKKLDKLEIMQVSADLAPLLHIPSLRNVVCSADMKEQTDKIWDKAKFIIEMRELQQ